MNPPAAASHGDSLPSATAFAARLPEVAGQSAPDAEAAPRLDVSVVVPFYNEEENILPWYAAVTKVMDATGLNYEMVAVDDGSRDGTFARLRELHLLDPRLRVIRFRRNFGQTAGLSAGFDHANGDVIVTMDGDLQNHPEDIPRLLAKMEEGYDIVSGWRHKRQDAAISRKLPSKIANWLISEVTGVKLHDYGCSLKAYRHEVVKNIRLYGEMHRFIPAIASWMGTSVVELPVNHSPRTRGKSKYGISRTTRVILDLLAVRFLLSFITKPIQIFGLVGLLCGLAGSALGVYLAFLKVFLNEEIGGRPLLMLAVLLVVVGVQFIVLGLMGEVLTRTYYEVQGKPTYMVRERLDKMGTTHDESRG